MKSRKIKRRDDTEFPLRRRVNGKYVKRNRTVPKKQITRRSNRPKTNSPPRSFIARKRKLFYAALKQRLPLTRCAQLAGISYPTYRKWMIKGKDKKYPVHRRLRYRCKQIEAANEVEALDIIRACAKGGNKVVETKVSVGYKGTETTRTVKTALPVSVKYFPPK